MIVISSSQLPINNIKPKSDQEYIEDAVLKSELDPLEKKQIFRLISAIPLNQREEFFKKVLSEIQKGKPICLHLFYDMDQQTAVDTFEKSPEIQKISRSISELMDVINLQRKMLLEIIGQPPKKGKAKLDNFPMPTQARKSRRARKIITKIPSELKKFTPVPKEEVSCSEAEPIVKEAPSPKKPTVSVQKKKRADAQKKSTGKAKHKNRKPIPIVVESKSLVQERLHQRRLKREELNSRQVESSPSDVRKVFYDKLTNPKRIQKKWKLVPRVQRWQTEDTTQIRQFEDKVGGQIIKQYALLNEEELKILRAKHYFPETERLLCKNYRRIYAISTERGYGVMAKFSTSCGKTEKGMLFFGCDQKHRIFHMFFEAGVGDKHPYQGVKVEYDGEEEEENIKGSNHNVVISEQDGVVEFNYGEYRLHVYPIDREALDKEVPRLQG